MNTCKIKKENVQEYQFGPSVTRWAVRVKINRNDDEYEHLMLHAKTKKAAIKWAEKHNFVII